MTFVAWPLTILGFYLRIFQTNSIEGANEKIKKYFLIFFILIPVGVYYIYAGIDIWVKFRSVVSIVSIIFGVLALYGFVFSLFMKKYSKKRFEIYKEMQLRLEKENRSSENVIVDYLEDTISEFGHKMFQNMNETQLFEDFNTYVDITKDKVID